LWATSLLVFWQQEFQQRRFPWDRTGEKEDFPPYKRTGKQKENVDFPLVIDLGVFPARSPNPTAQFDHRRNNSAVRFAKETG
jgi:hypothetical protein